MQIEKTKIYCPDCGKQSVYDLKINDYEGGDKYQCVECGESFWYSAGYTNPDEYKAATYIDGVLNGRASD
jgi:transposase-like protein